MLRFLSADSVASSAGLVDRREWLRISGLGGLAALLGARGPLHAAAGSSAAPGFGRAKSVILLFASGGQSQIDTWDPKPHAPVEIRGAFGSIPTALPGVRFCEHMPQIARRVDKLTLVRNMSHEDLDHGSATYLTLTGRYHRRRSGNPLPSPEDYPGCGSILQRVRPSTQFTQTAVHLNGPVYVPLVPGAGQFGGFLGKGYDPFTIGDVTQGEIAVPGLDPLADLPAVRLHARQSLLDSIDQARTAWDADRRLRDMSGLYRDAFRMLSQPQTRDAFDLEAETTETRDCYGRHRMGQACLLSRRLVEAGVPLVTVFLSHNSRGQDVAPTDADAWGWDTHNDIFDGLKNILLPRFDQTFATLLDDLDDRGLLEETLVICLGEFGRAPQVALEPRFAGASPGRKHWSWVYSIALAGAGVSRGRIVGASDSRGAYPVSDSYGPWDVTATLFSALGIDPASHYTNAVGQPFAISEGRVIGEVY